MTHIIGYRNFGLTLRQLVAQGDRAILVDVDLRHLDHARLFKYSPPERRRRLDAFSRAMYRKARSMWPVPEITRRGSARYPLGFRSRITARDLARVSRIGGTSYVWIRKISGMREKKGLTTRRWHAVKARFAVQVEGRRHGYQTYEEGVYLVKARSEREAQRKIERKFTEQAQYLNPRGERVRWRLEKVLNVDSLVDRDISPEGTEVYYELKERRMRPEHEWHPMRGPRQIKRSAPRPPQTA